MNSVNDLLTAIANREIAQEYIDDDISAVNDWFDSFRKYFNAVYEHVYGSSTLLTLVHGGRIDVEKYQDKIMELDANRRRAHENAIDACNKINRQCDVYGIEHLCPEVEQNVKGDCTNRDMIADFVGRYMSSVFMQGRTRHMREPITPVTNLDKMVEAAKESGHNPEAAYQRDDMISEAYQTFGDETAEDITDFDEFDLSDDL